MPSAGAKYLNLTRPELLLSFSWPCFSVAVMAFWLQLFHEGSGWVYLGPGTAGPVLLCQGIKLESVSGKDLYTSSPWEQS